MNAGFNQYPPMAGVPVLRERVAEKVETLYGARYDVEDEVTIVPGATHAIYTAVAALVRPGDEVILFEPAYDSYAPAVEVNGGTPVYVQLTYPDYAIPWQAVQQAITPRTRMIKGLKEWLAPLTNEQESRVKAMVREVPLLDQQQYADRIRRQKEFLEILALRTSDPQRFSERVTEWMVNWERGRPAEYQRQLDQMWQKRADVFVAIDKMLTPEQRTASLNRLDTYATDFTQLATAR